MLDFLNYDFMINALIGGTLISIVAPLIGIFLVVRRYSLISDTLSHTSLAGMATATLFGIHPIIGAIFASVTSSLLIEKVRFSKKISGDAMLVVLLSGSLALSILISSKVSGGISRISGFLFGSILSISKSDLIIIFIISTISCVAIYYLYNKLVYSSFDPENAKVSGLEVSKLNLIVISIASFVISASIPLTGALLLSSLMIIAPISALKLSNSFSEAVVFSLFISFFSSFFGIISSFYFNIPASSAICILSISFFLVISLIKK